MERASHGHTTDKIRSSCFRGTPVARAGVCSSVVRSAFVRRSVASCVAFVLCWFVWRSCAAAHRVKRLIVDVGASTFGHGTGRFATRGGLSTGQRRTCDGLLTDGRQAIHGRKPDTPRAAHGLESDTRRVKDNAPYQDGRRRGGRNCHGLHTDTRRLYHSPLTATATRRVKKS